MGVEEQLVGYASCTEPFRAGTHPGRSAFRQAVTASLTLERLGWSKPMGVGGEKVEVAGSDGDHWMP